MLNAEQQALTTSFKSLTSRWIEQQITHCLDALSQSLLDIAMSHAERDQALLMYRHHKLLEKHRADISKTFSRLTEAAMDGEEPRTAVIPQQIPLPEQARLISLSASLPEIHHYCHALRAEVLRALFQTAINLIEPDSAVRMMANKVFEKEFIAQLTSLYIILVELLETKNTSDVNRSENIEAWINHLEQKLRDPGLDSSTRALTKARYQELTGYLHKLDALSDAARNLQDRWLHPFEDLEDKHYTDEELRSEVNRLIALFNKDSIPRSLKILVLGSRKLLQEIALNDRGAFMKELHPIKRLMTQTLATVDVWTASSAADRSRMLLNVREALNLAFTDYHGDKQAGLKLQQNLQHYLDEQLQRLDEELHRLEASGTGTNAPTPPSPAIGQLEDINRLLQAKLGHNDLPPIIDKLIFTVWNQVIAKLWSDYGEHSILTQQALSLVDDIVWYLNCSDEKLLSTDTRFLASQLEHDLLNGLKLIDYNRDKGIELIASIRRLRNTRPSTPDAAQTKTAS